MVLVAAGSDDRLRRDQQVFRLLERRPLAESCTFLTYDAVREIAELPHLAHLSDSVVSEYEELADE